FDRQNGQWMYTPNAEAPGGCVRRSSSAVSSVPSKAGLRELQERTGAMGEAVSERRQAVFLLARHLAEGLLVTLRHEHRIVAEAEIAARGPNQGTVDAAFELLHVTVGPG